ncbi:MAG: TetR/AcrR family transcriptional regulator [Actinobacteria bacterium]|nr:TetR/AcrR family transcriptional regulator [Actinomycetota bacterium]
MDTGDSVTRERVLEMAGQLFLQHGYAGTSLKMIAQELDISAPALYWYFPSKEEIYAVVIETAMRDFLEYVRKSVTADDPVTHLSQVVRAHVTWQLNQADVARAFAFTMGALSQHLPEDRAREIRSMEREYLDDVREILRSGGDTGHFQVADVTTTAFAIITMCEYVHTWFNPDGPLSVEAVANRYERLALAMAQAGAPAAPAAPAAPVAHVAQGAQGTARTRTRRPS